MRSPPKVLHHVDIDEGELAFFRENGYLVCGRLTTEEELDWLSEVYDELIARPISGGMDTVFDVAKPYGSTDRPRLGQLLFPEQHVPAVRETAMWQNCNRIATRLLGLDMQDVEHWGHILYKTPRGGNETPWHQDEAYWDVEFDYYAVGAWMPLQDVGEDNGCLWFLPGSHKHDVLPHRHVGGDPAVHVLELEEPIDVSSAVPIPMRAGEVSFHHPRLLHYARENASDQIRRAWANEFQSAPIVRTTPADRPWVTAGREARAHLATTQATT